MRPSRQQRRLSPLLAALAAALSASPSHLAHAARSWVDVVTPPKWGVADPLRPSVAEETDPLAYSVAPSAGPTSRPTVRPTVRPTPPPTPAPTVRQMVSVRPTVAPTVSAAPTTVTPTLAPTDAPTLAPTDAPTVRLTTASPTERPTVPPTVSPTETPTLSPTIAPTADPWADVTNPAPRKPRRGYFNYDPDDGKYGLEDRWEDVDASETVDSEFWSQYGQYIDPSLNNNKCDDRSDRQSPIDLRAEDAKAECFEYHELRDKPGSWPLSNSRVKKRILPSKLRIEYPKGSSNNPSADVPKGWGHQLPVTHVDIKIPSEHWMEGKQYAAEYQVNIIQNNGRNRGAPVFSILLDLHPDDVPDPVLQVALDAFQAVWDADKAECEANRRRQRRADAILQGSLFNDGDDGKGWDKDEEEREMMSTWANEPAEEEAKFREELERLRRRARRVQSESRWDPWGIKPTIWFFGYLGSLTEPPCTEFIEWRIFDRPALISSAQLFQMKRLLFDHVDGDCDRTSVHHRGSVARPPQPWRGRDVHKCWCEHFISDAQRIEEGRMNCGQKFGAQRKRIRGKQKWENDRVSDHQQAQYGEGEGDGDAEAQADNGR